MRISDWSSDVCSSDLGPALRGETRWLVDDDSLRVAMDHHLVHIGDLILAQGAPLDARLRRGGRFGGRNTDDLPRLEPVSRRGALAIDAKLPCTWPERDEVEGRVGLDGQSVGTGTRGVVGWE